MTLLHSETNPLTVSAPINEAKLKTSEKILLLFDFMDTNDAFSSNLQHGRFVGCIILKQIIFFASPQCLVKYTGLSHLQGHSSGSDREQNSLQVTPYN